MGERMNLIAKGAEADLYSASFSATFFPSSVFDEVIIKRRAPKGYRVPELDHQLRRQRTISEARIIHDAREAGVKVPAVLGVWPDRCVLVLEAIRGMRLKEALEMRGPSVEHACQEAGRELALLHQRGIVHGDPTTSNMIQASDGIYLIDFGLAEYSESLEKRAVDLHLLKTAMKSTHFRHFKALYSAALKGYSEEAADAEEVVQRSQSIEKRGRYVER